MKNKKSIIIFWALFLVPTLFMAAIAARLLFHERDRINNLALVSLTERATVISQNIHLTVEAVQESLTRSLLDIPPEKLNPILTGWEETNPLVRNVFILRQDRALEYPVRGMESTLEERRFVSRYDSLFTGRIKFDYAQNNVSEETGMPGSYQSYTGVAKVQAPKKEKPPVKNCWILQGWSKRSCRRKKRWAVFQERQPQS